jgi:alkylation response protein AidB-like acyl-CoA dehydrogenase
MSLLASFQPATLPADAEALRGEVRAFLGPALAGRPPRDRARTWTAWDADFSRALAARGWLGLTLPKAHGGQGLTPFHRFAVVEELLVAGAPIAAHWIGDRQSAPLILKFGTEAQRQRFLPAIAAAEIFFCIGMSEPGSGSDLASVRTRAVRDGDGWRLSGRKIWTTHAHRADWMIALVRTSGGPEDRQKGLSQFLVDLRAPGVSVRPIALMTGDEEFSEVTFDDVALSADALVGAEGQGWAQVNAELAFERSGPERIYSSAVLLDLWAKSLGPDPDTRDLDLLGRLTARLATLRAMSIALTARLAEGQSPVTEAALFKDLGTGLEQDIPALLADRIAADPARAADPELLATLAYLLRLAPVFSLRGGTREILRGMIARGLGLR